MAGKHILILTNRVPYPLNDGGNLAMHAMVESYRKTGWQVYLLSMNTSRHQVTAQVLTNIYKDIYKFHTVAVDNEVRPVPALVNFFFSTQPNHAVRFDDKGFRHELKKVLESFKPEAVQIESVFLTSYLDLINEYSVAKTILRLHNIEWQVWQRLADNVHNPVKRFYLNNLAKRIKKYEEIAWAQYDMLLPITDTDADAVKNTLPVAQILVVPFGIALDSIDIDSITAAKWEAYHIGAMDWLPNSDGIKFFLEEVWPSVHMRWPSLIFNYAGRNMPESFKSNKVKGTKCYGEVPDAKAFIANKKILVVPLKSGGGIRVKVLEAMAQGKIIISTEIGMQGIDAISGKHFALANTPDEFVDAFNQVLNNKARAEEMGRKAVVLVNDKYNLVNISESLSEWVKNGL